MGRFSINMQAFKINRMGVRPNLFYPRDKLGAGDETPAWAQYRRCNILVWFPSYQVAIQKVIRPAAFLVLLDLSPWFRSPNNYIYYTDIGDNLRDFYS